MLTTFAQWCVILAGLWLIGLGVWMLARPHQALGVLKRMGGSAAIHWGEMSVRILAGIALILASEAARHPVALTVIGAFLIVSTLVILIAPRRWHSAFSTWWAARIPAAAVRFIAPLSWAMGAALIWEVWPWR